MSLIVDKCVDEFDLQLRPRGVPPSSPTPRKWFAKHGYDAAYGARPMARLIDEKIRKRLADELLFGSLTSGGKVKVDLKDGEPVLSLQGADTDTAARCDLRPAHEPRSVS